MKKFFISLVALLMIPIMCSAAVDIFEVPDTISVNDYSVVMNEETKSYIRGCNDALMASTESKVIFVTVPTTGEESVDKYATRLYNAWGVKNIGNGTSTFVLLATNDMEYWAIVGDNLKSALTTDTVNKFLLTNMEPDFAAKNFDSAIRKTFNAFNSWYTTTFHSSAKVNENNEPDDTKSVSGLKILGTAVKVILFIIVLFIVGLILFAYVKREIRLRQMARRRRSRRVQKFSYSEETNSGVKNR